MKKIPTLFERDWNGDRRWVTPNVASGCEWVLAGEGRATVKMDGTCCMVREGRLYKRRELKAGDTVPKNFEIAAGDATTGKIVGWVPVGDGPEDQWHREAFDTGKPDGTYELMGPKVQGNPDGLPRHVLIRHGTVRLNDVPRDYAGLRAYLEGRDMEGIVWHHPDGRMAKIKLRDFGFKRKDLDGQ